MIHADLALARRFEAAFAAMVGDFVAAMAAGRDGAGSECLPVAGGLAAFAGAGSPITQAVGLGMDGPVDDGAFDRLERFYSDRGSAVRLILCPLADPSLAAGLGARGYRPVEFENILVRPIGPAETFPGPPPGASVGRTTPGEAEAWGAVLAEGFVGGAEAVPDDLRDVVAATGRMAGAVAFLARADGVPAGGASLFDAGGLALLGGAAVLERFRRRGLHTALLHARLAEAARSGRDLVAMGAEPGGGSQRNVERLGFAVAYTRVGFVRDRPA